ncbi:hypothetical protein HNR39_001962 [Glaciimonas immobilis]|uniref:Uncharacterized protein n=1 Tax=Glaciimonas immobilis TaxID=728004 RepID=A0A840RP32_9BURK|nr:hypothetical protein [Glaciimonas immobilis]
MNDARIQAPQIYTILLRQFVVVINIIRRIDGGDGVFLFGPGAQIDLLAAFGAKGAEFVCLGPFDFGPASRTIDYSHMVENFKLKIAEG